jgi:hypothetical protein
MPRERKHGFFQKVIQRAQHDDDRQGRISLRLKRKDDASEAYVIVVINLLRNETLYPFTATEFNDFADAVRTMKGELSKANERRLLFGS